jgi:hypothetical protein
VTFSATNPSVEYHYATGTQRVEFYTLTSGAAAADPTGWTLSGSNDGATWTVLDERSAPTFRWRQQTRAFQVARPGDYAFYRLQLISAPWVSLAEIELLARP